MNKYIHYGHDGFILDLFDPIENEECWSKPWGGLWASPVDAKRSWRDYDGGSYVPDPNNNYFKFTLDKNARVFHNIWC